ncbi:hypothetical protein [Tautonia marina]|uniref:hypothetical protein n=1 Tax=Tautonia marina TaxID=2653855 RepID=UPI0012608CAD|nr:hypothetical protein [Tautonia marina]
MSDIVIKGDAIEAIMAAAAIKVFKDKIEGWQTPLGPIIEDAFKLHSEAIRKAVYTATAECVNSPDFAKQLVHQLNHKLANLVINKCSGLVEKSFNNLMRDEVLRTRLQTAVIEIIEKESGA